MNSPVDHAPVVLEDMYFITTSAVHHAHLFQHDVVKRILVDSMNFGRILEQYHLFAFVIMPNHVHILLQRAGRYKPAEIMREYKKSTANLILRQLECEGQDDLLWDLAQAVEKPARKNFGIWQEEYQAKPILSVPQLKRTLDYIHNNPLQTHWQLAQRPEQYVWSSARFYAGVGRALIPLSDARKFYSSHPQHP